MIEPTGILANATPCWVLEDSLGAFDERHWPTLTEALADLRTPDDPDFRAQGLRELRQNETPCWTAIAVCGYVHDEDGEGIEHWPDQESLRELLLYIDWTIGANGELFCPALGTGCDCVIASIDAAAAMATVDGGP